MRIAIFVESLPDTGGGFQQGLTTADALLRRPTDGHEFVVLTPHRETQARLAAHGIASTLYAHRAVRLVDTSSATTAGNAILRRLRKLGLRRLGRHLDAFLDDHRIDLALFNECGGAVLRIGDHPFMVTVWDLDHRDHPEFPEAYRDRVFERRERTLGMTLTRAMAVISNSAWGSRRIASLYGVDPHRIVELPFLPSIAVRRHAAGEGKITSEEVRRKYELTHPFVFYPVYYLPQKNHLYLLEGLVELEKRHGIALDAVFCGKGDEWHKRTVERQIEALGLKGRVRSLGWVPDEDIPALYQSAVALAMPTYCGPTNLPPLEAVMLGCPVVYSDLAGCREQMGDAALYCDLDDVSVLADHLAALMTDRELRDRLVRAGHALGANISRVDYLDLLAPTLERYEYIRRRWVWPA